MNKLTKFEFDQNLTDQPDLIFHQTNISYTSNFSCVDCGGFVSSQDRTGLPNEYCQDCQRRYQQKYAPFVTIGGGN